MLQLLLHMKCQSEYWEQSVSCFMCPVKSASQSSNVIVVFVMSVFSAAYYDGCRVPIINSHYISTI